MSNFGQNTDNESFNTIAPIESVYPDLLQNSVSNATADALDPEPSVSTRIIYWYHPDYVGNVDLVTDLNQEAYEFYLYNPWGESLYHWESGSSSWNSPFRFNSKEFDAETGMHYYGARYHHPKLSVWMSVDPLTHKTFESYQYTANNPIMKFDPDGRSTHTDKDGNVVAVYEDGYLGIYKHDDLSGWDGESVLSREEGNGVTLMGYTLYEKSFMDDNGIAVGKIEFGSTKGQNWINENEAIITALSDPIRLGKLKTRLWYAANAGNGDLFDYKTSLANSVYEGSQISEGVYASARDIGNYFAGSVARITDQDKKDFLVTAGAFNLHGNDKVDLIKNLKKYKEEAARIPITYGEDERSNYFQRLGYEGIRTIKSHKLNYSKIWKD